MNDLTQYEQQLKDLLSAVNQFNQNITFEEFIIHSNETPEENHQQGLIQFQIMNEALENIERVFCAFS